MTGKKKIGVFEALSRYALSRYKSEFEEAAPNCPYETRMGGSGALQQRMSWFVYEWRNPETGGTILDEFVQKKILRKTGGSEAEQMLASRLLLRKDIIYDEFEVVSAAAATTAAAKTNATAGGRDGPSGNDNAAARATITVRALGTQKEYRMATPSSPAGLARGDRFVGRIHPRGSGTYAACGVLTRPGEWDRPQMEMLVENLRGIAGAQKSERDAFDMAVSARIRTGTGIRPVLDGYPKPLLETMCKELDIDSLASRGMMVERIMAELPEMVCTLLSEMSKGEQAALAHVLHGGVLPYPECSGELARRMEEEDMDGEDPDDPAMGRAFVSIYTYLGLVIVGTAETEGEKGGNEGRGRPIVTVASDIKRLILECPGWPEYVKSDGRVRTAGLESS